jgi:hypothetical protein
LVARIPGYLLYFLDSLFWYYHDVYHENSSKILKNFSISQRQRISVFRQDLELSLDTRVMIKRHQHMFLNKILVKIDDLCENPDNDQAVFTEFHRFYRKINIEDPFTQVEFSEMFSIKIHHFWFCKKEIQNLWSLCFGATSQWEIGWLKVQEAIFPNFVFELFIR